MPGLETTDFFKPADETFPFGTHIAVVEVFPETGEVKLLRYLSVDDCGNIISPMLVTGQVHGGLAQGIGLALWEEMTLRRQRRAADRHPQRLRGAEGARLPDPSKRITPRPRPHQSARREGHRRGRHHRRDSDAANAVIDALSHGASSSRYSVHRREGLAGDLRIGSRSLKSR